MKQIGPTFWQEIEAAGANTVRFAWCDDGTITFDPIASDAEQKEVLAVYAAHDPTKQPPQTILSQDLMAQFTADDAGKIQGAVTGNVQFWLLWSSLQAQKDPMFVTNARFLAGWSALVQVLGQPRMDAIATELKVTVG